ncbi:programmed cell death protein 2 [Copidosoma floridanum]|uniref:programmed cell death protein 2 n=1 Tax=Copidosoma floridanum TaxID=29053 RepID=UPI0006C946E9|nr:programmed cell death protein 2 [Copidosoma floridanum]
MNNIIDIGFAEECESWRLCSRFFPSKIGGKPAWLDLQHIPTAEQLTCDYCQNPCIFLCQVYAPYDDDDRTFHRTLFVFVCRDPSCCKDNENGNVRVFRSQLSKVNIFYPSDPPVEKQHWRSDISVEKWTKTCNLCGIFSSKQCSMCKKVNYCGRFHQVWDWKNGHKSSCDRKNITSSSSKFLFQEYELVIERDDCHQESEDSNEKDKVEKYEFTKAEKTGSLQLEKEIDDDLLMMANSFEDKTFSKFTKRIKSNPHQVLRYNRGGKPLYISSENQMDDIPKCECGSERQFEFQIMPQLLVKLNLDNVLHNIDWGVLLIYTCKHSCATTHKYANEYVWKQDIVKVPINDSK